jgi:signal transduction histidine kinase
MREAGAAGQAALDVLQAGAKDVPEDRDRFLAHLQRDSKRLIHLAESLLVLARAQSDDQWVRADAVQIRPLLDDVACELDPAPGVEVMVLCADGVAGLLDRELAHQAVSNVAANAARHTASGSIVLEAGQAAGGMVEIVVRDTGSGMTSEQQGRALDRFYRAGPRGENGFGLGLAIAAEAVRAQGGTIELGGGAGGGTFVRMTVPSPTADA